MKRCISFIILVFIYACASDKTSKEISGTRLDIELSDDSIFTIGIDTLFESVRYIPLETKEDVLLTTIDKIVRHDGLLYILDRNQNIIYCFDESGKYVKKLDKTGEGGDGYYFHISDFQIEKDKIFVLAAGNRKIFSYRLSDFEYVDKISYEEWYSNFLLTDEYVYFYNDFTTQSLKNIHVMNRRSREIVAQYADYPQAQYGIGHRGCFLTQDKEGNSYAHYSYQFDIYRLYPDREEVLLDINFEEDKLFPKELQEASLDDRQDYCRKNHKFPIGEIKSFFCTDKYYVFSFIYATMVNTAFYSRKEQKLIDLGAILQTRKFPLATQQIIATESNELIQVIPNQLIEWLKSSNKGEVSELLKGFTLDDNPVLAIYKLK